MDGAGAGGLARLLSPRSVAVVGGREAEEVARQCDLMGFDGPLWPVNPHREEIARRRCYASVGELPGAPDAAFIAVPAEPAIAVAIGPLGLCGLTGT